VDTCGSPQGVPSDHVAAYGDVLVSGFLLLGWLTLRGDSGSRVNEFQRPGRVTGHLMFDSSHSRCTRGKPVKGDPSRISLWEVHRIYNFEVCQQGELHVG